MRVRTAFGLGPIWPLLCAVQAAALQTRCALFSRFPHARELIACRAQGRRQETEIGKQAKGFYLRPSSAIERGGGFFVPGLEGSRLRIVGATGVLVLVGLNRASAAGNFDAALVVSELLTVAAAIALIVPYLLPEASPKAVPVIERRLVIAPEENADELRWAVSMIRRFTPALGVALVRENTIVLLETSPELCTIPTNDLAFDVKGASRVVKKALGNVDLFRLLPALCNSALLVRSLHQTGYTWVIGVTDADAFGRCDMAWCERLLMPAEPLWGLQVSTSRNT